MVSTAILGAAGFAGQETLDRLLERGQPGTIAVPHGWGHRDAGWLVANGAGGANVNEITSAKAADLEQLSGMAHLNGVPVRLERALSYAAVTTWAAEAPI